MTIPTSVDEMVIAIADRPAELFNLITSLSTRYEDLRTSVLETEVRQKEEMEHINQEMDQHLEELRNTIKDKEDLNRMLKKKIKKLEEKEQESQSRSASPEVLETVEIQKKTGGAKEIKLPDPKAFSDNKEVKIDQWLLLLRNKLERNASLFPTEEHKLGYVLSRIEGEALTRMEPRLRKGSKQPFKTAEEILTELYRMYGDANRHLTAKNEFRRLRMKKTDVAELQTFWAEFQRLSAELDESESSLIEGFAYKLTPELQKHLALETRKATDLYELARLAQDTVEVWRNADRISNASARYTKAAISATSGTSAPTGAKETNSRAGTPAVARAATPGTALVPRRTPNPDPAKEKIMAEGRCFNCQEKGHLVKDCPKP